MAFTIDSLAGPVTIMLGQDAALASLPTVAYQFQDPRTQLQAVAGPIKVAGGIITSIGVRVPGANYTAAPTVTITGGGGSGATATTTLNEMSVLRVNVTAGGTGYTSMPFVDIGASNATFLGDALPIAQGAASQSKFTFGEFTFFARGTNSSSVNVELIGWNKVTYYDTPGQWKPKTLASLLVTLGSSTGPTPPVLIGNYTPPSMAHNIANLIAVNSSIAVPTAQIWTPGNNMATIQMDLAGSEALSLIIGTKASGTLTAANGTFQGY